MSTPKVSFWTLRCVYISMSMYVYACEHTCAGEHEWGGQMSKSGVSLSCSIVFFETRSLLYRAIFQANLPSSSSDQLDPLAKDYYNWGLPPADPPQRRDRVRSWDPYLSIHPPLLTSFLPFCPNCRWPQSLPVGAGVCSKGMASQEMDSIHRGVITHALQYGCLKVTCQSINKPNKPGSPEWILVDSELICHWNFRRRDGCSFFVSSSKGTSAVLSH